MTTEKDLARAVGAAGVGAWVWYTASGVVGLDEHAMGVLGIDPDTYDCNVKTWLRLIHPEGFCITQAELRTLAGE
jgi:hypothetical protein